MLKCGGHGGYGKGTADAGGGSHAVCIYVHRLPRLAAKMKAASFNTAEYSRAVASSVRAWSEKRIGRAVSLTGTTRKRHHRSRAVVPTAEK